LTRRLCDRRADTLNLRSCVMSDDFESVELSICRIARQEMIRAGNLDDSIAFLTCRDRWTDMDDHTYFLLRKLECEIYRTRLIIEQLRLHVAGLPPDRSSDGRRELRQATIALDRQMRIRAALLEPFSSAPLH
jgi:hypothetical protein